MRSITLTCLSVMALLVGLFATAAMADPADGWVANPGTTAEDGVVTLVNDGSGTSYENQNLDVPVENGDTITFEWRSDDVTCGGGVPRVFIQGGAYNTFDADPAGPGACGTDSDGDGWSTVTGTVSGITNGTAGYTGIVNDNPSDTGTIQVRNLTIGGTDVDLTQNDAPTNKEECKNGGWRNGPYRNQGHCVSSFNGR